MVVILVEAWFLRERPYQLRPSPEIEGLPRVELGICRQGLLGLVTILGFVAGYLIQTRAVKYWRSIDSMTIFLFALPSTVIGIGLIGLWNTRWTNLVYGTPLIIVLGYLAKYTALTSRISVTQLAQIPPSMEEAAQVAGAGWFRRMALIVAPLARRGLLAGGFVGYIFSLRDIGITMRVYPAGHETLPVRILTLMANGSPQLIAALCMLMIAVTLLPVGILWIIRGAMTRRAILMGKRQSASRVPAGS
ncbi:MAG: hypothetical protein GWP08_19980 [Nitrospiraceae bacterium]|nr:hypothetical protein [Nitrospiraceae bacterium]